MIRKLSVRPQQLYWECTGHIGTEVLTEIHANMQPLEAKDQVPKCRIFVCGRRQGVKQFLVTDNACMSEEWLRAYLKHTDISCSMSTHRHTHTLLNISALYFSTLWGLV